MNRVFNKGIHCSTLTTKFQSAFLFRLRDFIVGKLARDATRSKVLPPSNLESPALSRQVPNFLSCQSDEMG
jgi:hypothetical protein